MSAARPLIIDLSEDAEAIAAEKLFTDTIKAIIAKRAKRPAQHRIDALEKELETFLTAFLQEQAGKVADQVVAAYQKHQTAKALSLEKVIRQEHGKWHVYSEDGSKHLGGPYDTKDEAVERLRQVEHFKEQKALAKGKGGGKIVLMRHAEKLETSPHLSAQGHLHAERLASIIPDEYGVPDVVYAAAEDELSHRPVETARPLVDKYGIKLKDKIPHDDLKKLVKAVLKRAAKGQFVLVVWRHDELPQIAQMLGMKDVPDKWPEDDFSTRWEIDVGKDGEPLEKVDRAPIRRITYQGFPISIENEAGTYREWKGGRTLLLFPYGYIRGTMAEDGEKVDCYLGPNENAKEVYVVRQIDTDTAGPDEDKCFLGFNSPIEAREAFLAHRDDGDRAFGAMDTYTVEEFREKVHATADRPGAVKVYNPGQPRDWHGRWMGGASDIRQPVHTKAELYQRSAVALDDLKDALDRGQGIGAQRGYKTETRPPEDLTHDEFAKLGGLVFIAPLKSEGRAEEKVAADYHGDWSKLTDVTRATIAVDTMDQLHSTLEALRSPASGLEIVKTKDRFAKPTEMGYRDTLLNVRFPNGVIGEVQLHLKSMLEAKNDGHHLYEQSRSIEARNTHAGKLLPANQWSSADRDTWTGLVARQRELYDRAWERAGMGKSLGKYSEDQPRDERGRWEGGGNSRIAAHEYPLSRDEALRRGFLFHGA